MFSNRIISGYGRTNNGHVYGESNEVIGKVYAKLIHVKNSCFYRELSNRSF